MKIVKTQSTYLNSDSFTMVTYTVPVFSKVLNFFIDYNNLHMLFESDPIDLETKTIHVKVVTGLLITESNDIQKYWGTIKVDNPQISTSSNNSGLGTNLNISLISTPKYYHIFINEEKPLIERRDDVLSNILK
jgi:hypothetical protein